MSFAGKFLSAVVKEKSAAAFLDHGNLDHLFVGDDLKAYKFLVAHAIKHGTMPDATTFEVHNTQPVVTVEEPATYYLNVLKSTYIEKHLQKMETKLANLMQESTDDLRGEAAFKIVTDTVSELVAQQSGSKTVNMADSWEHLLRAYKKKIYKESELFMKLGWPAFDDASGGLDRGDVVSICGRPGQGKTMLMLYAAAYGWKKYGKSSPDHTRLFVSMEMDPLLIEQRLASVLTGLPMNRIKNAGLTTPQMKHLKATMQDVKTWESQFHIVDGNLAASVADIRARALQLKPAAIFIDGAYLLKSANEKDRYQKVANNADAIKRELSGIAPVICSWQLSREAAKLKKGEKPGLEHIAHADAIGQISSVVMALFDKVTVKEGENAKMKQLTQQPVTNPKQKEVDILKGRSGESGSFVVNWDWDKSDFSEVVKVDPATLKFT